MRTTTKILAVAALAAWALGITAGPASAEEKMYRGTTGCFTYSYKQGGIQLSTTVYYHNTCKGGATFTIVPTKSGLICSPHSIKVKGGDYGNYTMRCDSVRRVEGTWN